MKKNQVANKKPKPIPSDFAFEEALQQLTLVVEKMEGGELSLEQALAQFETGVALAKQCHQALTQAEQRVETLTANDPHPLNESE